VKIAVAYAPDDTGDDAVRSSVLLAGAARADLVLVNVHPLGWRVPVTAGSVDAEWRAFLVEQSEAGLERGRGLAEDVAAEYAAADGADAGAGGDGKITVEVRRYGHASSGRGLAEVAESVGAAMIVLGSAPGSPRGQIAVGSTADQLLHGSPVPVVLTPAGYRLAAPRRLDRVTVAYEDSPTCRAALAAGAQFAHRTGVPLRLMSIVERPNRRFAGASRSLAAATEDAQAWLREAAARITGTADLVVAEGDNEADALARASWLPGELLVSGSGTAGPIKRVFLGDVTLRILRASRVLTMVVPRTADVDLDTTGVIPTVTA
jgi:nucleotide-binding universal stress UspA family protein